MHHVLPETSSIWSSFKKFLTKPHIVRLLIGQTSTSILILKVYFRECSIDQFFFWSWPLPKMTIINHFNHSTWGSYYVMSCLALPWLELTSNTPQYSKNTLYRQTLLYFLSTEKVVNLIGSWTEVGYICFGSPKHSNGPLRCPLQKAKKNTSIGKNSSHFHGYHGLLSKVLSALTKKHLL